MCLLGSSAVSDLWTFCLENSVISFAGFLETESHFLRTLIGANLSQLTQNELSVGKNRVISGSVLCGQVAKDPHDYLGRYALQVSVITEGMKKNFRLDYSTSQ